MEVNVKVIQELSKHSNISMISVFDSYLLSIVQQEAVDT